MGTSYAGFGKSGSNFIGITGKLNNSGSFYMRSPGDEVNVSGHVNNSGSFGLSGSGAFLGNGLNNSGSVFLTSQGSHSRGSSMGDDGEPRTREASPAAPAQIQAAATRWESAETDQPGRRKAWPLTPVAPARQIRRTSGGVDNKGTIQVNNGSQSMSATSRLWNVVYERPE